MKTHHQSILSICVILSALLILASTTFAGQHVTDTFAVRCYDVGRAALKYQAGIVKVNSGWQKSLEVNHVTYDPDTISRQEVEAVLKEAGTYLKMLSATSSESKIMD